MAEPREWDELAMALADMARDLLAAPSVQETLDRIVAHAVALVEGCEFAGILVVRGGRTRSLAATAPMALASERIQGDLGEGPCFDAVRDRQHVYRIADMGDADEQWPRYAPKARELGLSAAMGFLLFTNGNRDLGALNFYSSRAGVFTERSERVGWLLASHSAVALAGARHDAELLEALDSRHAIGQATGIVMSRYKVTEREALAMIVATSQNTNTKVRDLADTINTIGDIPTPR